MTDSATRLVAAAAAAADDELIAARCELIRAKIAFAASRGSDAPPLLLAAAKRMQRLDPLESRKAYLGAVLASILVGWMSTDQHNSSPSVAKAASNAPAAPHPARALDVLLDGLVIRLTEGYVAAAPISAARSESTCASGTSAWPNRVGTISPPASAWTCSTRTPTTSWRPARSKIFGQPAR
ncbi:hypothetical protein MMEU_3730 [Mycobacterium marinum str. Europe]|nr:hypothetical protein MMEU_3730 [Mycobacterium marinum str. Europe]